PAVEAFFADYGSTTGYTGMTLAFLQSNYDQGIKNVTIPTANTTTYCVESVVGGKTWKKAGPDQDIASGPC
ncbi:MAG TPA: hypothetical protein VHH55_05025, partial [Gaiellaceae bacterium]|nr:hypothetical protein [Gaiellaceae bacterium]